MEEGTAKWVVLFASSSFCRVGTAFLTLRLLLKLSELTHVCVCMLNLNVLYCVFGLEASSAHTVCSWCASARGQAGVTQVEQLMHTLLLLHTAAVSIKQETSPQLPQAHCYLETAGFDLVTLLHHTPSYLGLYRSARNTDRFYTALLLIACLGLVPADIETLTSCLCVV